jgi:glycolate oxidase FAD binding subunit
MDPLEDLTTACNGYAAEAPGGVRVAGHAPRYVASPATTDEVAAVLRAAGAHGLRVVPRGAGTKLDWGAPAESVDLVLDCTRMDAVLEYNPADLVIRAQAGVSLAAVAKVCAAHGQQLALDPVVDGDPATATLGGTVAANAAGPLRLSRGTCRDLLIGVTVVRADGTVARSGGKVVKNVAGYDLGKLYTGSMGTLGVITETVFRLHPLPPRRLFAVAEFPDAEAACAAAARVRLDRVAAAALELDRPSPDGPVTVAALLTGAGGVDGRAARAAAALGDGARVTEEQPPWWGRAPWPASGTALKLSARLSALPDLLTALAAGVSSGEAEQAASVRGSVGAGVLHAGLPPGTPVAAVVGALRARLDALDGAGGPAGSVVVLRTPEPDGLDLWGPVGGLALMRRVKENFDPQRLLAPGRFVGGI